MDTSRQPLRKTQKSKAYALSVCSHVEIYKVHLGVANCDSKIAAYANKLAIGTAGFGFYLVRKP